MIEMIDLLESRRLFAASSTLEDRVLLVRGSDQSDVIEFQSDPGVITVRLNGKSKSFDAASVRSIRIDALDGDDRIILGRKLKIGATIFAGAGNDTVSGSAGDDTIFGGAGDDDLAGQGGNDYLDGQRGDDTFRDYIGRNTFHGGAGNDSALVDTALLGSGVESRKMVVSRGGPISPYDIYDVDLIGYGGTSLNWIDGRLMLKYVGATGSGSNRVNFSELHLRDDGRYEVEVKITTPPADAGGTADMKYFSHRWDVTGTLAKGLVFMNKTVRPAATDGTIPQRVERQSSVLLVAGSWAN